MFLLKPWHRAIGVAAFAGVGLSVLTWIAWNDPAINFLSRDKRAEWIVFPAAVDAHAHWFASLDATFRREFVLTDRPATARLGVRAMRGADVRIHGGPIRFPSNRNWKGIVSVDVAGQLQGGSNVIEARVFNHNGPPALWLTLNTDQLSLRSDKTWEVSFAGSSWRHAALAAAAKTPGPGNSIAGGEGTFDALKKVWPFWIVLIVIASVSIFIWNLILKNCTTRWLEKTLLLVLAGLWLLLFWNNSRLLPFHAGFDAKEHLKYINYIQEHRALPLANEGWEMYQPPLYYLIAAASLSACKLSINDPASILLLRLIGAFLGIAQFIFVFLSLRLLFSARTAFVGLLLAAFLPMHVYLAQYVTNEMLAATLATATLYACLRLLKSDTPSASQFAWVGFTLGATMLAKATTVLLLPIAIAAIAGKLAYTRARLAVSLRNLGLLLTICLTVCGWHYARIWLRFGTPLLGNWDVVSGFTWWQDPGYHTATDYLRFGRSLAHPLFSGFAGFADGIYSTLWGDALCGGASSLSFAWNRQPMVAGYLWAVIPTALILVGVRAASEALKAVEADPANATARGLHALSLSELGEDQEAIKEAERAVELNPTNSSVHLDLAVSAKRSDPERAIAEARRAIELGPENSSAQQFLMNCFVESHRYGEASDLGREWLAVTPYDAAAHSALSVALAETGDLTSAAQHFGYVMMLRPEAEQAHAQLRQILLSLASGPDGLQRLRDIAANAPDSPRMLDELAWLLATYPDSKSRDGTEAVRLAEHACALTERRIPALLDTLAAAYAEAGDFPRAISVAEEALNDARSSADNDAVKLSEIILTSLRESLPYRQEPE